MESAGEYEPEGCLALLRMLRANVCALGPQKEDGTACQKTPFERECRLGAYGEFQNCCSG